MPTARRMQGMRTRPHPRRARMSSQVRPANQLAVMLVVARGVNDMETESGVSPSRADSCFSLCCSGTRSRGTKELLGDDGTMLGDLAIGNAATIRTGDGLRPRPDREIRRFGESVLSGDPGRRVTETERSTGVPTCTGPCITSLVMGSGSWSTCDTSKGSLAIPGWLALLSSITIRELRRLGVIIPHGVILTGVIMPLL
mmetsp:Transcript_96666/g.196418  ORF Transcript_96666/g.196418 Transcript_96666/m.196418 type:complete len:199 (-) Transcript_96666:1884-2480(-)